MFDKKCVAIIHKLEIEKRFYMRGKKEGKKVVELKRNKVHNYIGDINTPLSTTDKTTGRQLAWT